MSTLRFDGIDDRININPLSTSLNNIPNGACTLATLIRQDDTDALDIIGLRGSNMGGSYYHGIRLTPVNNGVTDDDGVSLIGFGSTTGSNKVGSTAGDFFIVVLDWGAGTSTPRVHTSAKMSDAESWSHSDGDTTTSNRAGPGTGTGYLHIGNWDGHLSGCDIALIAVWAGVRFSDADVLDLWTNKKTSDWYNHAAGQPDTLIELISTNPVDIGTDPASSIALSGPTLAGLDPTGWTFDGQGVTNQLVRPDADVTTTGWTTTPLYSKINDESDSTVITATAS